MNLMKLWLAIILLAAMTSTASADQKLNLVLVVADDLGLDAGCYGNPKIKTPRLDALAAEGIRFSNAFCTTASCSASRSVLLSGQHNHANGHYGHQHGPHKFSSHDKVQSLPVLLRKAGYKTARAGKYHVAPEPVYQFDEVVPGDGRGPVILARNCEKVVQQAKTENRPFFLYYCTTDPHRSGQTADELPGKPNRFGNRAPKAKPIEGVQEQIYNPSDVIVPPFLPDTPTSRAELAQYYQSVSRMDQALGELIDVLKRQNVWDQTFLVFLSDNGIAMPGAKTNLYDSGMHLPCVVHDPRTPQKSLVNPAMISWVNIAPTFLDRAGALSPDISRNFHGRSFAPILGQTQPKGWDQIYASHTFHEVTMYYPMRVVRDRQYKLIWNLAHPLPFPFASDLWAAPTWQDQFKLGPNAPYGKRTVKQIQHRPAFELYDLKADPDEIHNLANDPKHLERLTAMKQLLKQFQEDTDDPWVSKWEYE